jgi:hypothetical protein
MQALKSKQQKDKIIKKKSIDKNEGEKGYFREP